MSPRKIVEIKKGKILESKITSIDKSRNGYVGSKNAVISYKNVIGNITKNTNKGLYGIYTSNISLNVLYKTALWNTLCNSYRGLYRGKCLLWLQFFGFDRIA